MNWSSIIYIILFGINNITHYCWILSSPKMVLKCRIIHSFKSNWIAFFLRNTCHKTKHFGNQNILHSPSVLVMNFHACSTMLPCATIQVKNSLWSYIEKGIGDYLKGANNKDNMKLKCKFSHHYFWKRYVPKYGLT